MFLDLDKAVNSSPWYVKILHWWQRRRYGTILEPIKAWSLTPTVLLRFLKLWNCLNRKSSPIEPKLRAWVMLWVSMRVECEYCVDWHLSRLLKSDAEQEKISEISNYEVSPLFSEEERCLLKYAELMTATPVKIPEALIQQIKTYLTDKQIAEISALIAFQNMSSRFNAGLGVVAHGFCAIKTD